MGILHNHRFDLYPIPAEIQVRDPNLIGLLNPHFFDAGEEGGGFEACESCRTTVSQHEERDSC